MADQISSLVFRVDSRQAISAQQDLDAMTAAAGRAEQAQRSLGSAGGAKGLQDISRYAREATSSLADLAAAYAQASAAGENNATNTMQESAAMAALLARLDPLVNAFGNVAQQALNAGTALTNAAGQAQTLTTAASGTSNSLDRLSAASARAAMSGQNVVNSARSQQQELAQLLGEIDPVTRALDRLDDQQRRLRGARRAGLLDNDTFEDYNNKIEEARRRTGGFGDATRRAGMSAAQTANALRMLPAQFTDIAVSLASGQNPLLVFLQQGGQIKDMFGGMLPALKAMAGYIVSLITPLAVASAGFGALFIAAQMGANEQVAFTRSLILSGNALGLTTSELRDMSLAMAESSGTVGKASSTLAAFAKSARVQREALQESAQAAQVWQRATGQSIQDTIEVYNDLARDPVQAITKLTEQYRFLDAATLERITSLQRQGREEEAAALAQQTYTNMIQKRGDEVVKAAGLMERAWNALAGAAKWAWDEMAAIGRPDTIEQQLKQAEAQLEQLQDEAFRRGAARRVKQVTAQQEIVNGLRAQVEEARRAARAEGERAAAEEKGVRGLNELGRLRDRYATQEAQRAKLLKEAAQSREDALAAPSLSADQRSKIEREYGVIVAEINKQFDKRGQAQVNSQNSAQALLETLRAQNVQLAAQLVSDNKIGAAAKRQLEYEQKFTDLRQKGALTTQDRLLLSKEKEVRALLAEGVELERNVERRNELVKLAERSAQIMSNIESNAASRAEQFQREEGAFGLGERLRKQVESETAIRREFDRAQQQLTRDINLGRIDPAELERRRDAIRVEQSKELDELRAHYDRMADLENDWSLSFQSSMQDAADSMRTAFQIAGDATRVTFDGLTGAINELATTGKLSWRSLVTSVLGGLAQIASKAAASGIFSLLGMGLSAVASTALGSLQGLTPTGAGWQPVAGARAGGGGTAPNSLYEVNERGVELYHENGRSYLMTGKNGGFVTPLGDAAPAVAPQASGGIGDVYVSVNVDQAGNVSAESSETQYKAMGEQVGRLVRDLFKQEQIRSYRPGGTAWASSRGGF